MKRLALLTLTALMAAIISACGGAGEKKTDTGPANNATQQQAPGGATGGAQPGQ